MISIGVLGYGVVGSGVVELINKNVENFKSKMNKEINVSKVLVRNPSRYGENLHLLTNNVEDVIRDDVDIIVEVMGGLNPAYDYVKRALTMKKHVVTANKDLIAAHGDELSEIADKNGVSLYYEASVGGGIPIIRPMTESLAANDISQIVGILNGTTNFILTKMYKENMDYDRALEEAQRLGFAEANPESDVMGYDAARKLSILSSIAFNRKVDWNHIHAQGITEIDGYDMILAKKMGCTIKLFAISRLLDGNIFASVRPVLIDANDNMAKIENEFNGICLQGDAIGNMMFTGKGAGKLPTASAVIGDIVDIIQNHKVKKNIARIQEGKISSMWMSPSKWLLRVRTDERHTIMGTIGRLFSEQYFILEDTKEKGEIVVLVEVDHEERLDKTIETLKKEPAVAGIKKMMKIEGLF